MPGPIVAGGVNTFLGGSVADVQFQGDAVQDTAALTALLPENRFDKQERFVEDDIETYYFDLQSSAGSSPPDILVPDDSPAAGRWIKLSPGGGVPGSHAPSHAADTGSDALSTAAAGAVAIGDAAAVGTAETFARADHQHSLAAPAAPADVTKAAAATGSAVEPARADHKHDASTAAAGAIAIGDAAAEGAATSLARSDHKHSLAAPAAPADVTKAAAAAGAAVEPARADHKHDVSTAAPSDIGTANAEGAATSLARSDHVHDHGTQTDGTLHADVIAAGADGFMTGTDKTKLDGIEALADVTGTNAPQAHKDTHKSAGGDAFTSTDLLEAIIKRLQTSTGPTTLLIGAVADKQFLQRSGTALIGATPREIKTVTGSQDVTVASGDLDIDITGFTGIKRIRRMWFWISANGADIGANTNQPIALSFFSDDTFKHFIANADPNTAGRVKALVEFHFVVQDVKVGINNGVSTFDIDDTALYSAGLLLRLFESGGPTEEFQRIKSITDADTLVIEDTIQKSGTPAFAINDDVALVSEVPDGFDYEDQDGTGEVHMRISPGDTGGDDVRLHWVIEHEIE